MPIRLSLLFAFLAVAACTSDRDRVVPPSASSAPPVPSAASPGASPSSAARGDAKHIALAAALDTLQALVVTLEQVRDPITAWNHAADASRLLNALEREQATYILDMSPEEARGRYPHEIARLEELEARRDQELDRIMANPTISRMLIDEMNKAEMERAEAAQR